MNVPSNQEREKHLWIGKVEVRPHKGSARLGSAKGAFVNVVTWACDVDEFHRNADLLLGKLGLFVVGIENAELVSIRSEKAVFEEEIEEMIDRAHDNPNAIIYGTFHTWDRDTA